MTYAYKTDSSVPDVFMLEIMSGISRALHEHHYDLLVVHVDPGDTEWPHQYLDTGRVDGFIVLSATCTERHIAELLELKAPVAMWGSPEGHEWLLHRHRRQLCRRQSGDGASPALGPKAGWVHRRLRRHPGGQGSLPGVRSGVCAQPETRSIPLWSRTPTTPPLEPPRRCGRLLEQAPDLDSVFVNSDVMAISAMDAIRDTGRTVPRDVAVVGYDDISIAQHSNPPLTTIRQNGPLAGKLLAESLIQCLRTGVIATASIPAELVVRLGMTQVPPLATLFFLFQALFLNHFATGCKLVNDNSSSIGLRPTRKVERDVPTRTRS